MDKYFNFIKSVKSMEKYSYGMTVSTTRQHFIWFYFLQCIVEIINSHIQYKVGYKKGTLISQDYFIIFVLNFNTMLKIQNWEVDDCFILQCSPFYVFRNKYDNFVLPVKTVDKTNPLTIRVLSKSFIWFDYFFFFFFSSFLEHLTDFA